jgi:phosphoketolase
MDSPLSPDLIEHKTYVRQCGDDIPEVRDWKWSLTANVGSFGQDLKV